MRFRLYQPSNWVFSPEIAPQQHRQAATTGKKHMPPAAAALYPDLFPTDEAARKAISRTTDLAVVDGMKRETVVYQVPGNGARKREAWVPGQRKELLTRLKLLHPKLRPW